MKYRVPTNYKNMPADKIEKIIRMITLINNGYNMTEIAIKLQEELSTIYNWSSKFTKYKHFNMKGI